MVRGLEWSSGLINNLRVIKVKGDRIMSLPQKNKYLNRKDGSLIKDGRAGDVLNVAWRLDKEAEQ